MNSANPGDGFPVKICRRFAIFGVIVPPLIVAAVFLFPRGFELPVWAQGIVLLLWPLAPIWAFLFLEGGDRFDSGVIIFLIVTLPVNAAYFAIIGFAIHWARQGLRSIFRSRPI